MAKTVPSCGGPQAHPGVAYPLKPVKATIRPCKKFALPETS